MRIWRMRIWNNNALSSIILQIFTKVLHFIIYLLNSVVELFPYFRFVIFAIINATPNFY